MLELIKKLFGDKKTKDFNLLKPIVDEINVCHKELENISEDDL
jgi:preprotein translocase subunit SecA